MTTGTEIEVCNEDVYDFLEKSGRKYRAVLSDPPYALSSGSIAEWDNTSPAMDKRFWEMLSNRLLPGALVFCFASSYRYHRVATAAESAGYEVLPMLAWIYSSGMGMAARHPTHKSHVVGAQALRPAVEPIIALQRNRQGLSKSSCLELFGTGGINIEKGGYYSHKNTKRRPTNVLSDFEVDAPFLDVADVPGAVYAPKASKKERDAGLEEYEPGEHPVYKIKKKRGKSMRRNPHPTVKPLRLLRTLAGMLLPPEGFEASVLIPFSGTGSEIIASAQVGFSVITGVEINSYYVRIAIDRAKFHVKKE